MYCAHHTHCADVCFDLGPSLFGIVASEAFWEQQIKQCLGETDFAVKQWKHTKAPEAAHAHVDRRLSTLWCVLHSLPHQPAS